MYDYRLRTGMVVGLTILAGFMCAGSSRALERYEKRVVLELVRQDPGGSGATPYTYTSDAYPHSFALDGKGNIYLATWARCEIRKYDPKGKYLTLITWNHRDCPTYRWWFKVDGDGSILICWWNRADRGSTGIWIDKLGRQHDVELEVRPSYWDTDLIDGYVIDRHKGKIGKSPKAGRLSEAKLTLVQGLRVEDRRALRKHKPVRLVGPAGSRSIIPKSVGRPLNVWGVIGLDGDMNCYAAFSASDPKLRIKNVRGVEFSGSRHWIGKYSRKGELLTWIEAEYAPRVLMARISEKGDVYQEWDDVVVPGGIPGKVTITKWERIK